MVVDPPLFLTGGRDYLMDKHKIRFGMETAMDLAAQSNGKSKQAQKGNVQLKY